MPHVFNECAAGKSVSLDGSLYLLLLLLLLLLPHQWHRTGGGRSTRRVIAW